MRTIGEALTPEETAAFIAAARRCVKAKVRFRHMGRDPKLGLDCAGLAQWAIQQVGRPVWDIAAYSREPHKDGLRQAMIKNLGEPIKGDLRPGDVVLMRFEGDPKHVGIIGDHPHGGLSIIHTYGTVKRVVEQRMDSSLPFEIVEAYRP